MQYTDPAAPFSWGVLWVVGLYTVLLAGPVGAQPTGGQLVSSDTVRTRTQAVLWEDSTATVLKAALPAGTSVVIEKMGRQGAAVQSDSGRGWLTTRAFESPRAGRSGPTVRLSQPPGIEGRPFWQSHTGHRRYTATLDRLHAYLTPGRGLSNHSHQHVLKYAYVTLRLHNAHDSTSTAPSSRRTVRVIGPLHPGASASYRFRNVGRYRSGVCVSVHRMTVEHLDGGRFVYDLHQHGGVDSPAVPHSIRSCLQGR